MSFVKQLKFDCVCIRCNQQFKSGDVKTKWCPACSLPKPCACGCGQIVKSKRSEFVRGHKHKGKTYLEMYGTSKPSCGFKSGLDNPNYNIEMKQRATASLKLYYKNNPDKLSQKISKSIKTRSKIIKHGQRFRSSWEVEVFEILSKLNISFIREVPIILQNGRVKIVDFVVDSHIFIEVTGLSFSISPNLFSQKINDLHNTINQYGYILLITNQQLQPALSLVANQFVNTITSTREEFDIINSIKFLQRLNLIHKGEFHANMDNQQKF